MNKSEASVQAIAAAHIKFANALHEAYIGIGRAVKPIKLSPGTKSRRETLLKQIKQLQDKMDTQWFQDCPSLAKRFDSIYLNDKWAADAARSNVGE